MNTHKFTVKKLYSLFCVIVMFTLMLIPTYAAKLTAEEEASLKTLAATWNDESAIPADYKYDYTKASSYENTVQVTLKNGTNVLIVGDKAAQGGGAGGNASPAPGAGNAADKDAVKGKVNDIMQQAKIEADTAGASKLMSGFQGVISLLVGILAYIIVIGLPLFSALDIAYITIPVLREKADDAKDSHSGGGNMMVKSNGKLRWISDEAVYACKAASMEEGKGALGIYFGKRVVTYIVCAIVLYLLISGNIQIVTQIAVNLVAGIMDVISGLGD